MPKELLSIPVRGGAYAVARWAEPDAPVLLAVHGITSTHMSWPRLVGQLRRDYDVLAPDLRGRGGSRALPGPFGLGTHVEDLLALLDTLKVGRALWVGHSLGAYLGVEFALRAPERLSGLVLVDGGVALPLPAGESADAVLARILGPALTRLELAFPDNAAYRAYWRAHPAFQDPRDWNAELDAFLDYDLTGEVPRLRSGVNPQAVREDGRGPLDPALEAHLEAVAVPTLLLTAARGILDQPQPMMPVAAVEAALARNPRIRHAAIADTNHYSILMGRGSAAVARHIDEFAEGLAGAR